MAAFTIEDIELIRRKSGISYQEAVALLDYHNGNVARALVDLERNGRLKDENASAAPKSSKARSNASSRAAASSSATLNKSALMKLVDKLFRARLKVHRGETAILNISLLFTLVTLLISPHLALVGVIVCMALGYKITFDKHDAAFDSENLARTVRTAADNVKATVNDFAKSFQTAESSAEEAEGPAKQGRSYYSAQRAEPTYRPSYPTMNVPVQVESQDGSVTIESDSEGYSSATVE